jgi:hypothetical protein
VGPKAGVERSKTRCPRTPKHAPCLLHYCLIALRVLGELRNTAASGRGPWHIARSKALSAGLSNAYFRSLGLPSLTEASPPHQFVVMTAPSDSTGGGLSADHGHKPELGDVRSLGDLASSGPLQKGVFF